MKWLSFCLLLPSFAFAAVPANLSPTSATESQPAAFEAAAVEVRAKTLDRTVLKMASSVRDTPRSIEVMEAEELKARDMSTVNQALDYIPGVFNNAYGTGAYHFYARGYRMIVSDTRVDGFTGMNSSGNYNQTHFGVDRLVYLRGPAGLLYGATGSPGGMINLVGKKPQSRFKMSLDQSLSQYAGQGIGLGARPGYVTDLDLTGPLGVDQDLQYRLLARLENDSHFIQGNTRRNQEFQVSLAWAADERTRFTLIAQSLHYDRPAVSNRISPLSSQSSADGRSDLVKEDMNGPDVNLAAGARSENHAVFGYDMVHQVSDSLTLNQGYRYRRVDLDINEFRVVTTSLNQANAADAMSWRVQRQQIRGLSSRYNHNLDLNLSHQVDASAGYKNHALLGVNAQYDGTDVNDAAPTGANQSYVNIYSGQAETPISDPYPALSVRNPLNRDLHWNLYLQDQFAALQELLVLTLGLGYGEQTYSMDYGRASTLPPANNGAVLAPRKGKLIPNAALMVNVVKELGVYLSFSHSYSPATGSFENAAGQVGSFEPVVGVNYEAGVKWDAMQGRMNGTLNGFWSELTNTLNQTPAGMINPNGNQYYVQTQGDGLLTRGIELSSRFRLLDPWTLELGGAYVDAFNRSSAAIPGALPQKSPRWSAQGHTRYDIQGGPLKGLGSSLSLIWQAERNGADRTVAAPDPLVMPAFLRLDLAFFYQATQRLQWALHVGNALDELIFVGGAAGNSIEVYEPRKYTLRLGYKL